MFSDKLEPTYTPLSQMSFSFRPSRSIPALWRNIGFAALSFIVIGWLYQHTTPNSWSKISRIEAPIFNATLGFQKILVLNVPSRTDHADWVRLSAAVTDLHVEFVDGINGDDVLDKALPYPPHRDLGKGNIGSWRAHMNAMAHIVANNITSALILEDDVDWDIRIKQQMRDFSRGSRALTQPIRGSARQYADATFLEQRPKKPQQRHELGDDEKHIDFSAADAPETVTPTTSPYGDDWDVLWLGHCGMHFARSQDQVPKGRYLLHNDETMLPKNEVVTADPKIWPQNYPDFSRVVYHAWDGVCTYAYAVSQRGARKILWEFGIKRFDMAFDNLLSQFCDMYTCLTVQPQLFSAFAAPGPINRDSEINGFGQDKSTAVREKGVSENIQRSVRLNMQSILDGVSLSDLEDQYPPT